MALHDTANSIATLVFRTRHAGAPALRGHLGGVFLIYRVSWSFGVHVARTIGVGMCPRREDAHVIFRAPDGAIFWNLITGGPGIPSSSSHALIGGLVGAGVVKAGIGAIVWPGLLTTGAFIVLSPLLGFFLARVSGAGGIVGVARANPRTVEPTFQLAAIRRRVAYFTGAMAANDARRPWALSPFCCSRRAASAAISMSHSGW